MLPRAVLQPWQPIRTGVWCLVWTSCNVRPDPVYLICPCTVCFHFCLGFCFCFLLLFLFITHSPTHHTQLLVLNETPEPRSVEFFSLIAFGNFLLLLLFFKEIAIFKLYRVFKRFGGFCFVNVLFYSWGRNQTLGKGYISLYICVHSGKLDLKKARRKKKKEYPLNLSHD